MIHSILVPEKTISIKLDERFFAKLLEDKSPTPEEAANMVGDLLFCVSENNDQLWVDRFKARLKNIMKEGDGMIEFYEEIFTEEDFDE